MSRLKYLWLTGWVYIKNARAWKSVGPLTEPYVFDLVNSVMNGVPLDFHGRSVPADVQGALKRSRWWPDQ